MNQRDPLRDALNDLPRDIQPRRDLWPAIEARLEPPTIIPFWRRQLSTAGLLVAATIAVVMVTSLGNQPVPLPSAEPVLTSLDRDYALIRADVLDVLDHRCDRWQPSTCDGLRSGLRELDRSATDLRLAMSQAPVGSPESQRLATRYQRTLEQARGLAGRAASL